jgi:hypothetical protein
MPVPVPVPVPVPMPMPMPMPMPPAISRRYRYKSNPSWYRVFTPYTLDNRVAVRLKVRHFKEP